VTERLHWKDAEDAARWLKYRPADLRTLSFAAWLPFTDAYLIADLVGLNGGASIYRSLGRLREADLLASIRPPLYRGHVQDRYYLTDLGLATLAFCNGIEVARLVNRLHLGGRHLLALLPHLEDLASTYELLGSLARSREGWPALLAWERPYRRRYYRPMAKHPASIKVPAYAALSWDGEPGAYFLIPDRGTFPLRVYRPLIDHLFGLQRAEREHVPLVVIATTHEGRQDAWWQLIEEVRLSRNDYPFPAVVACWHSLTDDLARSPKIHRHQDHSAEELRQRLLARRRTPRRSSSVIPHPVGRSLVPPRNPTETDGIELVALRLACNDYDILDLIAEHPYLTPHQIAVVRGQTIPLVQRRLNRLRSMGLLRLVEKEEIGHAAALELPELTVAGLELVAAHRGLSLPVAVRALGLIGGGPDHPFGPRRRLLLHLTHTRGADDLFVRLYQTAGDRRAAQRDEAVVQWDNGTMCSRRHLRPDGYGMYRVGDTVYGFFLEFDRGTMRRHGYLDKFDEYYDYAVSRRFERDYNGYPTILFVTVNNATEEKIAEMARVAARRYGFSLPMLLTCLWRIDDSSNPDGLLGRIWREPHADFDDRRRWINTPRKGPTL